MNCLKYSEKRIASIHGNFLPTLAFILFAARTWLSKRNSISPGLKVFHITHYLCSECSFVFFLNRLTANERASISKAVLEIVQMRWYTYIHTYIHTHIHTHIHTYIHTYIHELSVLRNKFYPEHNYLHTCLFAAKNLKWRWLRAQATQAGHVRDLN